MTGAARAAATVLPAVPRGFGDRRAAQAVYRKYLRDSVGETATATIDRATLQLDLTDWPQAQAYLLRRYDPSTVEFVSRHLGIDGVFIDAGSHIGLIALQVAMRVPSATVHAFEPHPVKFAALKANITRNGAGVKANNFGLSDRKATLAYDAERHMVDGDAQSAIEVVTLDDYAEAQSLGRIDVVKLDIEGHEPNALRGASGLLEQRRIGAITMESLHGDTSEPLQMLEDFGYERVKMPDPRPRWIASRRPMPLENVGFVARS